MISFSQRLGLTPIKATVQLNSMDEDLKIGLWNAFVINYLTGLDPHLTQNKKEIIELFYNIWLKFLKRRFDYLPNHTGKFIKEVESYYFGSEWYHSYDFINFVASCKGSNYEGQRLNESFINSCNKALIRELSGYRFIDGILSPITSEVEIETIENVANSKSINRNVKTHIKRALELLSDRKNPDYRNSIKESISAVESYCAYITGSSTPKLSTALAKIEKNHHLHSSLKEGFNKLYGYSSDESGIRHAIMDEKEISQEDALFMLISCSAFINYLQQKATKQ